MSVELSSLEVFYMLDVLLHLILACPMSLKLQCLEMFSLLAAQLDLTVMLILQCLKPFSHLSGRLNLTVMLFLLLLRGCVVHASVILLSELYFERLDAPHCRLRKAL